MRFYTVLTPVIDWADTQIRFRDAERFFNVPELTVAIDDLLG